MVKRVCLGFETLNFGSDTDKSPPRTVSSFYFFPQSSEYNTNENSYRVLKDSSIFLKTLALI